MASKRPLSEEEREGRRARRRELYARPDSPHKVYNKKWAAKNQDKLNDANRKRYREDPKYREYGRIWAQDNKEKRREILRRSWVKNLERNRGRAREKAKEYLQKNREMVLEKQRLRYRENPEVRQRAKEYKAAQIERYREHARRHRVENPELYRAYCNNRRSRLMAGGTHTAEDIKKLMKLQRGKCVYCTRSIKEDYHVDHIVPLALDGTNDRSNLQLLCPTCNMQKGRKHPIEFAQQVGFLL